MQRNSFEQKTNFIMKEKDIIENAENIFEYGQILAKNNHFNEAIQCFNIAIETLINHGNKFKEDGGSFYYQRGNSFYSLRQWDDALSDYNNAIQINPDLTICYFYRANIYLLKDKYEEAICDYNQFITTTNTLPKNTINEMRALAFLNRGKAFYHLHQLEKALNDTKIAISLNHYSTEAQTQRAEVLAAINNNFEDLSHFDIDDMLELWDNEIQAPDDKEIPNKEKNSPVLSSQIINHSNINFFAPPNLKQSTVPPKDNKANETPDDNPVKNKMSINNLLC